MVGYQGNRAINRMLNQGQILSSEKEKRFPELITYNLSPNSLVVFKIKLCFEIIIDSHVIIRNITQRSCVYFNVSPVSTSYKTYKSTIMHLLAFLIQKRRQVIIYLVTRTYIVK